VGAGPAGLECTRALGQRGYRVTLSEAGTELGGRLIAESRLPGLSTWMRVAEYRLHQISEMQNVEIYRDSRLCADEVIEFGFDHVVLATGAHWTRQLLGASGLPVAGLEGPAVYDPEDVMADAEVKGPVVIYDFDHYYMGNCLAEVLSVKGIPVALVTPASSPSSWTFMNNELGDIRKRLAELGVRIVPDHRVTRFTGSEVHLSNNFGDSDIETIPCESLVIAGARAPHDTLYHELDARADDVREAGIQSVRRIGDCLAPGAIVHAVYSGHQYAREHDRPGNSDADFKRERPDLSV
jgi:dimethylamine/trimethylamine dehydrogenase